MAFALTDTDAEVHKAVEVRGCCAGDVPQHSTKPRCHLQTDTHTSAAPPHARAQEALWKLFMRSGNAEVDARMQQGMQALLMQPAGLERAKEVFNQVIEMAPDFAEGYNKRATVHYLLKDFASSIADCEKVVSLNPLHFGALSGAGLCYVGMQDYPNALAWFKRALAVNPGMAQIRHYDRILRSAMAVQEEAKAKAEALRQARAEQQGGEQPGAGGEAPQSSA